MDNTATHNETPNNYEAECAALCAMISDNEANITGLSALSAEDFYAANTRSIFAAMKALFEAGASIDIVTIKAELEQRGMFDVAGGMKGLAEISSCASTSAYIERYVKIIVENSRRRKLILWAQNVEFAARQAYDFSDVLTAASSQPALYGEPAEKGTGQMLREAVERVCKRYLDDTQKYPGLPTGVEALDKATDGFYPGETVYLCADPGVGKSLLLTQILAGMALDGKTAVYFNYELSDSQISDRTLASTIPIAMDKIKYPKERMRDEDFNLFRNSDIDERLEPFLYTYSNTRKTAAEIRAKCKALELRGKKPQIIGVDYIQLMRGNGRDAREILENNSAALKSIAEEFECPVIVVSSLNRGNSGGKEKGLRNSGQLEYDAGRIILLERDYKNPSKAERCRTTVKMLKNRDGTASEFLLDFDEDYLKFS